jgi:adenylate cyclase
MSETRKLAAILVADIVGYSRLASADEDRTLARVRGLRSDLIDPAIAAHHGRIVKRTGDGAIIEFRSVVDAVRCAIEVQNGLIERNAGVSEDRRIEYRVGIHLGDVVEEADGDLMGDGVNIAARLEGVAKPGAICLSEQAYWQVKGRLDLKVIDLGATQLKNIAEPIHVYSLEVGQPALAKPATKSLKPKVPPLALLGAGIVALVLIAAGAWYFLGANRTAPIASNAPQPLAAQRLSIVVLPFSNLSGDPAQDYLADALTDQLTTGISRLHDSFVIARNTAMTFKGKPIDAKAIGKDLGVHYVLEGSVLPTGGQVRVNAQLIDAGSRAHIWADQFDTPRADLLKMQDEIVTRLARALELQLPAAEAARLKRTAAVNPDADDLALQCWGTVEKNGFLGKEAEAGYPLCEQALAIDPGNVRALTMLAVKYYLPILCCGGKGDLKKADELLSRALAADPNLPNTHDEKAWVFFLQQRYDEAVAEEERAIALDPSFIYAFVSLGVDYQFLGQFEKSNDYLDTAIRLSPRDSLLNARYGVKAENYFALKQYDQAIDWARRAIAVDPNNLTIPYAHAALIAALALTGREGEARGALQRYLALPPAGLKTISEWKAAYINEHSDPRFVEWWEREFDGLRKAGMPEE